MKAILKLVMMTMAAEYTCIHEEQIQGQSRKIEALETRADYKEDAIKELKDDMKELKKSMDSLDKTINDYIIKSIEDDNTLKSYINSLENRITALEAADSERWKFYLGLGTAATVISLIINHFILK